MKKKKREREGGEGKREKGKKNKPRTTFFFMFTILRFSEYRSVTFLNPNWSAKGTQFFLEEQVRFYLKSFKCQSKEDKA